MLGICLALCNPIVFKGQVGSSSLMCASYCGHAEVARCCIGARVDMHNLLCAQISAIAPGVMHALSNYMCADSVISHLL